MEYTKWCVHNYFANATAARQKSAREAMNFVAMIHKQVCPMEMMTMMTPEKNNTCNVNASLWCLGRLGNYLSRASAFHTESQCE
jgi:hypothetical protein